MIVDWALTNPVGGLLEYTALPWTAAQVHHAVQRALPVLERDHRITLENVRGIGYRIADVYGHLREGRKHHQKSIRSVARAGSKVDSVDRNKVTDPALLQLVENASKAYANQLEIAKRVTQKVDRRQQLFALAARAAVRI